MKMRIKKIIAMLLALCLILSAVPVSAATMEQSGGEIAAEQQSGAVSAAPVTPAVPEVAEEVTVIREEESLRGEYEKHFLMSDGSYQAEVYAYPVHELVDGVWVELAEPGQNARGDVTAGRETTNILDNFVWKDHGVQSSTGLRLYIGSRSGYTARTYIQFATMPTIPAGATITAATMKLTMVSGTSLAYTANAYQVTGGEWDPTTIQWTNKPAANVLLESNISNNDRTKYQFSVLTAVRHWYDGDPTGQNENYGIMLRYYDETLTGYYNSVYSGNVVDTNSRPRLTITYRPGAELDVDVGATRELYVSGTAETVTWESEDPSVATVDANGVVTGIKAGFAVINAYVGGEMYSEFTIWVTVPDGVYYLKSASVGLYLTSSEAVGENDAVKLNSKVSTGSGRMLQLWCIAYAGGGRYSIRSMSKVNMGISANATAGSAVGIANIGMVDYYTSLPSNGCWGIEATSDGSALYFNHTGLNTLAMRPVEGAVSPGMGVKTGDNSGGNYAYRWTLEQVTGFFWFDGNGLPMNTTSQIVLEMGRSYTKIEMGAVCVASGISNLTWSSSDPEIVSVNATTGTIFTKKRGEVTLTITGQVGQSVRTQQLSIESIETIYVKNYYDNTVAGNATLLGYIDDAVNTLNDVYRDDYHINYVIHGEPQHYTYRVAATEACERNSACNSDCAENCIDHHKNVFRIAHEAYNLHSNNQLIILWSNSNMSVFCEGVPDENGMSYHQTCQAYATVVGLKINNEYVRLPVIQVLTMSKYGQGADVTDHADMEFMSITLIHEVAHTLGLKEQNDEPNHGVHDPWTCIMGVLEPSEIYDFYVDYVMRDNLFCPNCLEKFRDSITDDAYEHFTIPEN